jgi:hypothetical protein
MHLVSGDDLKTEVQPIRIFQSCYEVRRSVSNVAGGNDSSRMLGTSVLQVLLLVHVDTLETSLGQSWGERSVLLPRAHLRLLPYWSISPAEQSPQLSFNL